MFRSIPNWPIAGSLPIMDSITYIYSIAHYIMIKPKLVQGSP